MNDDFLPEIKTGYGKLHRLLFTSYLPKIINAAIEIELFEALADLNLNYDDLAMALDTAPGVTKSLCDILIHIKLLKYEGERLTLTSISREFLIKESKVNQLGDVLEHVGSSGPFDNLVNVLKGEEVIFNSKMWTSKKSVLSMAQGARGGMIQSVTHFVTSQPEFKEVRKMCDLAGSTGHYARELIKHNPQLDAYVFDLPEVIEITREMNLQDPRLQFHPCDLQKWQDFGNGYDLFFISHFLYEYGFNGELTRFLTKVNRSMVMGGLLISNHISSSVPEGDQLTMKMVELLTNCVGYPTHTLPQETLEKSLLEAGFDNITFQKAVEGPAYPTLKVAARKIREA